MNRPSSLAASALAACTLPACLLVAPKDLNQLDPDAFHQALLEDTGAFLVDVHVPEQEHLAGTDAFVPYREVEDRLDEFPEDLHQPIYLYCLSGHMVNIAARSLLDAGYTDLYNLDGGTQAWDDAGLSRE